MNESACHALHVTKVDKLY